MTKARLRLSSGKRLNAQHHNVLNALNKALDAADAGNAIRRHVRLHRDVLEADDLAYRLNRFRRIFVIGAGKATAKMAEAIEKMLGDKITGGFVIVPDYLPSLPKGDRIRYSRGSHPIPSGKNLEGVADMLDLVKNAGHDDLILTL